MLNRTIINSVFVLINERSLFFHTFAAKPTKSGHIFAKQRFSSLSNMVQQVNNILCR